MWAAPGREGVSGHLAAPGGGSPSPAPAGRSHPPPEASAGRCFLDSPGPERRTQGHVLPQARPEAATAADRRVGASGAPPGVPAADLFSLQRCPASLETAVSVGLRGVFCHHCWAVTAREGVMWLPPLPASRRAPAPALAAPLPIQLPAVLLGVRLGPAPTWETQTALPAAQVSLTQPSLAAIWGGTSRWRPLSVPLTTAGGARSWS